MNIGQTTDADNQPVEHSADTVTPEAQPQSASQPEQKPAEGTSGPLASIARGKGPLAVRPSAAKPLSPMAKPISPSAKGPGSSKPGSPSGKPAKPAAAPAGEATGVAEEHEGQVATATRPPQTKFRPKAETAPEPPKPQAAPKLTPPNLRQPLAGDLQAELDRELAAAMELEDFLGGSAGMASRKEPLEDGQRVHGTVLKIHEDSVFVALGGPDEGVVPLEQFTAAEPAPGDAIEVIVRGISKADGLYQLTLPGEAINVTDWSDIESGSIVEATVTGSNSGGLECTVAGIAGFIPISQISEHRIEDTSEFVGQKFLCVVTEANPRRGNLVVSRRGVLEREREAKRQEQLDKIEEGDLLEGVVRTVKDFGAFVDLGGLEGLIHISKLSWERIKHPSEVIEVGQKVKVKVDKIDKQTGKMSLSYRDLLENPWDLAISTIAPGALMNGTVTRVANFGAFVRIAAGIEGLVHISEVAGHRVSNVSAFLKEGQEVAVKVLSIDRETQKIALSIKQAIHKPEEPSATEEEEDTAPPELTVKPTHTGPLKGGNNQATGGERFGLRW
jgi:small subunit ribosomal protein S1